ncbi:cAMP-dependent protein kinase inhibitor beta isoform X1 [Cricetulus griseus]|uniref:cAMP-dependent protein kinase inhibitor beta isoform X1 n=2 Tax=Cricetulus griseus TaxID=10029 RepID=A0A9J7FBB8_CRIGR|nr:cAMP-dependent protein kinase inhibitor beta isoform X1 [Cricetulus griseus]XP_027254246.1 cAMP-dependent protein kinase inhibitor beta isoform X1 [Cricetulus griseus]XP_027254248.1 cAMP-dependent protein kinase inhibitor beta isoform X1 [Cricetulus griseus]
MDKNLDDLGGQKETSDSSKGSDSPGSQQDAVMRTDSSEMTDVESVISTFAASARAGRRNALADIQTLDVTGGTSDLPLKLEALTVKEDVKKKNEEKAQDQPEKTLNEEK